jgi:transposase
MRGTGRAKSVVWRWQERFMREGVDGLLRDKTRPPGRKPLDRAIIEQVTARTAKDPPGETTHWTAGLMAKTVDISISSVQRIWQAHGLQPHRVRRLVGSANSLSHSTGSDMLKMLPAEGYSGKERK